MAKNLILTFLNIISFALLIWGCFFLPLPAELNPFLLLDNWNIQQEIINLRYNSWHKWSFDPLLNGLLAIYNSPVIILVYSLSFFSLGWTILFNKYLALSVSKHSAQILSFILTVSLIIALLIIYQVDYVMLSAFTWVPFFILGMENFLAKRFTSLIYFLLGSVALITSSNQVSLFLISFFLILILSIDLNSKSTIRNSYQTITFFGILLFAFFWSVTYPKTNFFDYTLNQRVLDQDFFTGLAHPLFGPSTPIKIIDFQNIKECLIGIAPYLLAFSIICFSIIKRQKALWILFTLNLCLFLDIYSPYQLKHILPLETLTRIIPHLSLFPFSIIISICSVLSLILILLANRQYLFILPFLVGLVGSFLISPQHLIEQNAQIKKLTMSNLEYHQQLVNSPAAQILLSNFDADLHRLKKNHLKHFRSLKKLDPVIITSHNSKMAGNLIDKDPNTFWSSKLAKQEGTEWIKIEFPKEISIHALELSSGNRHSDFARGIKISKLDDCSQDNSLPEVLFERNPWIGSLAFTKLGYPYYNHESKMKIFFPKKNLRCLKIQQTGHHSKLEWAINEIKYLK